MPAMTGMILRLVLPLLMLFAVIIAVLIAVIRVQPYDDGGLNELFATSEACNELCLMGIRPGLTTPDEVLAILQASPWIDMFQERLIAQNTFQFVWQWNGKQPAMFSDDSAGAIAIGNRRVISITLQSRASLGDIWMATGGAPEAHVVNQPAQNVNYSLLYSLDAVQMRLTAELECPLDLKTFWGAEAILSISASTLYNVISHDPREVIALCRK